jgi:two-component system OmpR family sensor kinase
MPTRETLYGLVIAGIGFVLTRFTVTLAATDSTGQFLFGGIVPLVLGLSLAAFGVILAVGTYDAAFVRTTAVWCVLGTGTMLVLVVLTILGSEPDVLTNMEVARERTYLSNFLIGGAVGGTLTGLYAGQNRRHRTELRQQANRLVVLNRLLRDQVINAATAIKGYTGVLDEEGADRSANVIEKQADAVIETVENVKYLSETADRGEQPLSAVDVGETLTAEVDRTREAYPDVSFDLTGADEPVAVRANARVGEVFRHLLENAAEYSQGPAPSVSATVTPKGRTVTVRITDEGPGLPDAQRALLEDGEIAEYDDPTTGFGLNIVRLLTESFDGRIRTTVGESGSTVEVVLPRARDEPSPVTSNTLTMPAVAPRQIELAVGASLVAGVAMAAAMIGLGGDVPVIGALYGAESMPVAMVAHEFHSVVFGLIYAAVLSAVPATYLRTAGVRVSVSVGLSVLLWLVAAGVIMPAWLRWVGLATPVPNLAFPGFVGHVVWGLALGVLYHAGDRWLTGTDTPVTGSGDGLTTRL